MLGFLLWCSCHRKCTQVRADLHQDLLRNSGEMKGRSFKGPSEGRLDCLACQSSFPLEKPTDCKAAAVVNTIHHWSEIWWRKEGIVRARMGYWDFWYPVSRGTGTGRKFFVIQDVINNASLFYSGTPKTKNSWNEVGIWHGMHSSDLQISFCLKSP